MPQTFIQIEQTQIALNERPARYVAEVECPGSSNVCKKLVETHLEDVLAKILLDERLGLDRNRFLEAWAAIEGPYTHEKWERYTEKRRHDALQEAGMVQQPDGEWLDRQAVETLATATPIVSVKRGPGRPPKHDTTRTGD